MKNNILDQMRNTSIDNVIVTCSSVFEGETDIMANVRSCKIPILA